jgi:hypothetical protein
LISVIRLNIRSHTITRSPFNEMSKVFDSKCRVLILEMTKHGSLVTIDFVLHAALFALIHHHSEIVWQ